MKQSAIQLLNRYVEENSEVFTTDGEVLFCKVCNKSVSFDKKFLVEQHLRTQKHIDKYTEFNDTEKGALRDVLNKYVLENSKVLETDGEVLFCRACNTLVAFNKKELVDQHLRTEKHIANCNEPKETSILSNKELLSKYVSDNNDVYETNGKELFCKICKKSVSFDTKYSVYRHLKSHKHIKILHEESNEIKSKRLEFKPTTAKLLKKYISENNEVFETDGEILFCKVCKKSVSFHKKFSVDQHLKTQKHKDNFAQSLGSSSNEDSIYECKDSPLRPSTIELLNKYVAENNDVFETDGEILFCKVCKKSVSFDKKFSVDQHLKTQKHKHNFEESIVKSPHYISTGDTSGENSYFSLELKEDLCRTCMKQFSEMKQKTEKQSITEIGTICGKNTSIVELLEVIQPQIKVEINENLPKFMCSECIKKLLVAYEFIEMYQNVDKKLRKMVKEIDMYNCNNNSDEEHMCPKEIDDEDVFEDTKYEIEIEQINIDDLEQQVNEKDNEWSELENELSDDAVNVNSVMNDGSDDDWIPKKSWLNASPKKLNCDVSTNSPQRISEIDENSQLEEHNDGGLQCPHCESIFDTVKLMREHMRQKHVEKKTKRAYNRRTNAPRKRGATRVSKSIPSKQGGSYQCEYCEKRYSNYIFYRTHIRAHTVEPHLCIECGKSFARLSSFNTHMLRHKGEKSYQCPQCPKSFVCSSGLYGHMMVHTNNKPYVCDICGAAFHMAYQLRHHNLYHAGIKKFQCEYCDMRFVTREKQRRHMRTHTGEKPYRCKYCERAFAQSNDCVKHLRQHLGDNVYQCDLCPLRFPLVRDLRVHFATHKGDDEETRNANLQARMEEERELQNRLCTKETE